MSQDDQFAAIVIGTGFAGAVTACRLVQAGLRICVLERGRRYEKDDFPTYPGDHLGGTDVDGRNPTPSADFARWRWRADQGLWDVRDLDQVIAVQAAGYGGGSLIYANVHLRAPKAVFLRGWPAEYRRGADGLDPYYDLAAYMLDVQPIPDWVPLAKTAQLKRAAHELGRGAQWFRPPLAVNFNGRNKWGRHQHTCKLRGECWRGCSIHAKNTLDLNYLAITEDLRDANRLPLADIRTLAEVISIERTVTDNEAFYTVKYQDHLLKQSGTVHAETVFLCAGAVNTTELLLRNVQAGRLPAARRELIGKRYHLNADSLAAVFDCDQPHQADRGPTITGALLYDTTSDDGQNEEAHPLNTDGSSWFLIQDGGFPADMEPLLGIFRSPLWMRRNRYLESPTARAPQRSRYGRLPPGLTTGILSGVPAKALAARGRLTDWVSDSWYIEEARYTRSVKDDDQRDKDGVDPKALDLWPLLPDWLKQALDADRDQLLDYVGSLAEPIISTLLDEIDERMARELNLEDLLRSFGITGFDPDDIQKLRRGLLRLAAEVIWGSESDMARHTAKVLLDQLIPGNTHNLLRLLSNLLVWALDYRAGDGYTGLLLTMGRDQISYQLDLEPMSSTRPGHASSPAGPRLLATYRASDAVDAGASDQPDRIAQQLLIRDIARVWRGELNTESKKRDVSDTPERITQQLLLRDVAQIWHGELRTDPMWPFLRRRVTVHGQGGCAMAEHEPHGVTRPNGEVYGCPGLYVMDAAAFPTSVGVNPSATIAAVAEYKVEQFINSLDLGQSVADEIDRRKDEAKQWAEQRRTELDPVAALQKSHPRKCEPVGVRFTESMEGYHAKVDEQLRESFRKRQPARHEVEDDDNGQMDEGHAIYYFRGADLGGGERPCKINAKLVVTIEDLAGFLKAHQERETTHETSLQGQKDAAASDNERDARAIAVTGSVVIAGWPEIAPQEFELKDTSRMLLFDRHGAGSQRSTGFTTFDYRLEFNVNNQPHYIHGIKKINDDPGLDVWQDTTTLYFGLYEKTGNSDQDKKLQRLGILRVPARDFFNKQLRSIEVTNAADAARQSWALGAFAKFFFGRLKDIYVPEIDKVVNVVENIVKRTHV